MASKTSPAMTNGSGARKCLSWIDRFVEHTANLDSPTVFRRWAAIGAIAAALEQKVWITTSSTLYPNLYTFLIGHPGVGKTRAIRAARGYLRELADFHLAPPSLTFAALVDNLVDSKRMLIRLPDPPLEYNSMTIAADELGTFVHKYDKEMIDGLSAFYDPDPYGQRRRGKEISIKIKSPQLNILCGSTPSNLMELMPEGAWGQGFTSRIVMVFSDERPMGDDFAAITRALDGDLLHDLKIINGIVGEFKVSADYRDLVNAWREAGEEFPDRPKPSHPKLLHYCSRRRVHLYKLSMIAALDRSNALLLGKDDFNTAMNWLTQIEADMADIFKAGSPNSDAQAMEEIMAHVRMIDVLGKGVPERKVVEYASKLVPNYSVLRVIEVMVRAGMLECIGQDQRTQQFWYKARSLD